MQKELLEINVNGSTQDCVISHYMKAKKDDNGKVIYTNISDAIAKCEGAVFDILIYVKDENDFDKARIVKITPFSIKAIYNYIMEIEAKQSEEFVEP